MQVMGAGANEFRKIGKAAKVRNGGKPRLNSRQTVSKGRTHGNARHANPGLVDAFLRLQPFKRGLKFPDYLAC